MKKFSKKLMAILLVASMLFTNTSAVSAKGWWFSFLFENVNKAEETTIEETTTIEESLVVEEEEKVEEAGEEPVGANSVSSEQETEEAEEDSVKAEDVEEPEVDETEAVEEADEESVAANSVSPEEETEKAEEVVVDENEEEKVSDKALKESSSDYRRFRVKGLKGNSKIKDDLSKLPGVLYYKDNYLYVENNTRAKLPRGAEIDFNSYYYGWSGWYTGAEGSGEYITYIEEDWESESIILYAYMPEAEFDTDPIDVKADECLATFYDKFGYFNYNYCNRGIYQVVKKGSKVNFPEPGNNIGWEFKGWFLIDTEHPSDWWIDAYGPTFNTNTPISEDSCFCAYWEEIKYPIVWHSEEVKLTDTLYENYGNKTYRKSLSLDLEARSTDLGHGYGDWWYEFDERYNFVGFYEDPNFKVQILELPAEVEGPYHVYVKWELDYVDIEFVDRNKGIWIEKLVWGDTISEPEVPGKGFKHWYLVYSLDGCGNTYESLPEVPYEFGVEKVHGRKYRLESVYEDDVITERYASFRFVTDYGSAPNYGSKVRVRVGEKLKNPGAPTDIEDVKGLKFSYWYLYEYDDDDMSEDAIKSRLTPFNFDKIINEQYWEDDVKRFFELKAYWVEGEPETETEPETEAPKVEIGKVEFVLNGAEFKSGFDLSKYENVELNKVIYLPTANDMVYTSDSTAVFKGWYKNKDLKGTDILGVNLNQPETMTLYAKWKVTPKYKVEFVLNNTRFKNGYDASKFDAISVNTNMTLPTAGDLVYTGNGEAEFAGWYRNADLTGDKVESVNESSATTIKVYPKWNVVEYVTIEIGPSLRYRYLREQYNSKTDYSSIFVGGTNVTLKVKKGEKITVPDMNNSIHFRTYDLTYKDVWTGFTHN